VDAGQHKRQEIMFTGPPVTLLGNRTAIGCAAIYTDGRPHRKRDQTFHGHSHRSLGRQHRRSSITVNMPAQAPSRSARRSEWAEGRRTCTSSNASI